MEQMLREVQSKVDKIDDKLVEVDKHLAVYNEQLKSHIKRTENLENEHALFRKVVYGLLGVGACTGFLAAAMSVIEALNVT